MLKKKRSRRIPALFTTQSIRPYVSTAAAMICCALAHVATLSVLAMALPPSSLISSTTRCAGPWSKPSPANDAPMSLMTTEAPSAAIAKPMSRPMPPPPPVTTTTLLSVCWPREGTAPMRGSSFRLMPGGNRARSLPTGESISVHRSRA